MQRPWDDVKARELPMGKVREARREEVSYTQGRVLWESRPIGECWEKFGKSAVSISWVDTGKGKDHDEE